MPEKSSPTAVFYGSATAETTSPPKQESKIVHGVKTAVSKWLERIGPSGVEQRFVKAHTNILATLNGDQRKEVFAKELESWRKTGKRWGIAATVIDVAIASIGAGLSIAGFRNPDEALAVGFAIPTMFMSSDGRKRYIFRTVRRQLRSLPYPYRTAKNEQIAANIRVVTRKGYMVSSLPALGSLALLLNAGPGHWLAHLAAGMKERSVKKGMARK